MEKTGQFYILAATVIAVILAGLITIVNFALVKPEPVQFYDLSKQLEREAGQVIEYGVYNDKDVASYVDNFVKNEFLPYAHEKDPNIGVIYIYGNASQLVIVNYGKNDAGIVSEVNKTVLYGSEANSTSQINMILDPETRVSKKIFEEKSIFGNIKATLHNTKFVQVNIGGKLYDFPLKGDQYFFAVVDSQKDGENFYSYVGS